MNEEECFNCGQQIEEGDGDVRHSVDEGDQMFCATCLDTVIDNSDEWN